MLPNQVPSGGFLQISKFGCQHEMLHCVTLNHSFSVLIWNSSQEISTQWCCFLLNHSWFLSPDQKPQILHLNITQTSPVASLRKSQTFFWGTPGQDSIISIALSILFFQAPTENLIMLWTLIFHPKVPNPSTILPNTQHGQVGYSNNLGIRVSISISACFLLLW